jgi:hypothetical protein
MASRFDLMGQDGGLAFGFSTGISRTGLALGSAYTYDSAGAAIGAKFVAPTTGNLTDVYFFVTASLGTPGVTTVELRNIIVGTATIPGTTLHATQTITPGTTAVRWICAHFTTPYSVTKGVLYWIVIGDAGWTTGNTTTIAYKGGPAMGSVGQKMMNYTTADGFHTAGTAVGSILPLVLKFADGTIFGNPYTTTYQYASSTLERGFKINGLTENIIISGVYPSKDTNKISGLKIYKGTAIPGSTPELTVVFGTGGTEGIFAYFTPFTLIKNTVYRIVFTFSAADTYPLFLQIENYIASTDLLACGFGGGTWGATIDNNAGGWSDSMDMLPRCQLAIQDQVSITGGAVSISPIGGL